MTRLNPHDIAALIVFVGLFSVTVLSAQTVRPPDGEQEEVCFVPGSGIDCAERVVSYIAAAEKTIDVQQFQLTEPHVAAALTDAFNRGVKIRLIVDKKAPGEKDGQTPNLVKLGIPTWIDAKPHIAHNKVIIVDDLTSIGGSFNMTTNADIHNAENVIVIQGNRPLADAYEANFTSRLLASTPYDVYESEHPPEKSVQDSTE